MKKLEPLSLEACRRLAAGLEDVPEMVISRHALHGARCRAFAREDSSGRVTAIVDPMITRGELVALGDDADTLAEMLSGIENWSCVEVPLHVADPLAERIEKMTGRRVSRLADVYFLLEQAAPEIANKDVRVLTAEDADLYAACAEMLEDEPEELRKNLAEGPVVAAIVDGRVVGAVEANVRTARYANLCADVAKAYWNRGLATAMGALAARTVQEMGLIPLWSAHEENYASLRVAKKLGFREVGRWMYLIPG